MKYTKEFLISELKRFYQETGEIPKHDTIKTKNLPSSRTYIRQFGSWNNAVSEAGFLSRPEREALLPTNIQKINICKNCQKEIHTNEHENKIFCNKSCSANFNNNERILKGWNLSKTSKDKIRDTLLQKNNITINDIDSLKLYKSQCKFSLSSAVIPFILGYQHKINNPTIKYHKDHRYSKSDGFVNSINPEILKHPANCEFLSEKENCSKHSNSSISLEQLLTEIYMWNSKFPQYKNWFNPDTDKIFIDINKKPKKHHKRTIYNDRICQFCGSFAKAKTACESCNLYNKTQILKNLKLFFNLKTQNLGTPEFINDWNDCKNYAQSLYNQYSSPQLQILLNAKDFSCVINSLRHLGINIRTLSESVKKSYIK